MSSSTNRPRRHRRILIRGLGIAAVLSILLLFFSRVEKEPTLKSSSLTDEPLKPASFTHEVRPILAQHCFSCHSSDQATPPRLDTKNVSTIFDAIHRKYQSLELPPDNIHQDLLTLRDSSLLKRWHDEGGQYEPHWAFQPLPHTLSPAEEFQKSAWAKNKIDQFYLEHLDELHLRPTPNTDILTLLRRVTIDFTGRPPSLGLLEESFTWEDQQQERYLALIDELISSKAFGETLGGMWFDTLLFRHDSEQEEHTAPFSMWKNWVTSSFNENRPIDEFLHLQIAGDHLAESPSEALIATAIFRAPLREQKEELSPKEQLRSNLDDRLYRLGKGFFGFPIFDPTSGRTGINPVTDSDLQHLRIFFQAAGESGTYPVGHPPGAPALAARSTAAMSEIFKIENELILLDEQLQTNRENEQSALEAWLESFPHVPSIPDLTAAFHCDTPGEELTNQALGEHKVRGSAPNALVAPGVHLNALVLGGGVQASFLNLCPTSPNQAWTISAWVRLLNPDNHKTTLFERTPQNDGPGRFFLEYENGKLRAGWERDGTAQSLIVRASISLDQASDWGHLTWTCNGSGNASGLQLYWNGIPLAQEVIVNSLPVPVFHPNDPEPIYFGSTDPGEGSFLLDELHAHQRALTPLEITHLIDQQKLSQAFENPGAHLRGITDYFFSSVSKSERTIWSQQQIKRGLLDALKANPKELPILEASRAFTLEKPTPLFSSMFADASVPMIKSRLELADWMTGAGNPLTARVFVNHVWKHFFGNGLAPTGFGLEGEAVLQHKLLDWLARDFVKNGWNLKRLCRQIVLSNTYRQSRLEPHFLSPHQQHNVMLHLCELTAPETAEANSLFYQPALNEDWAPTTELAQAQIPEDLLIKSARRITQKLLLLESEDQVHMRELFLRFRSQDENHPEFTILMNLLEHQKKALATEDAMAPKLILGGGAKEEEQIDYLNPAEWAAWIETCTSLLNDQGLRRQR